MWESDQALAGCQGKRSSLGAACSSETQAWMPGGTSLGAGADGLANEHALAKIQKAGCQGNQI